MSEEYLPIKVIFPDASDTINPENGGGGSKIFDEDNLTEHKESITNDLTALSSHFNDFFEEYPSIPCVAKVTLRNDAIAKTHRPTRLINERTCPIIGIRNLGELLISVNNDGLTRLKNIILKKDTKEVKSAVSAIERIAPYGTSDIIDENDLEYIKNKIRSDRVPIKLKIFNHQNPSIDQLLNTKINSLLNKYESSEFEEIQYAENYNIYKIDNISLDLLDEVINFVGTQSVSVFPYYSNLRTQFITVGDLRPEDFPPPEEGINYPIIGIIDSGVDPDNKLIEPWVVNRHVYVDEINRDYNHGTFVAGLCIHSKLLNNNDPRFPSSPAKIIDVVAMPDSNKSLLSESRLLEIINEVVLLHPEVRVWNLSVGLENAFCLDSKFSDFAIALDEIQKSNNTIFAISAGNLTEGPLRGWPPSALVNERIISPADSVMGITVGSIANIDNTNTLVKTDDPSPFTRCGPGPAFIPKPELTHYGGNCSDNGTYTQSGILSIESGSKLSECVGTSFSTPLVSNILSNIINSVNDDMSISMAKALLIHSSIMNNHNLDANAIKYLGFGKPQDIPGVLNCNPWSITLILEVDLIQGLVFQKLDFPLPDCLRNPDESLRGDICATLVYDTPLEADYGSEYCRTNVDVSLGTYDKDSKGKPKHKKQIFLEPRDISELYEEHLIKHGFKWSPVKVYKRSLKRVSGENWRLYIKSQHRKEFITSDSQPISLVISISDPSQSQPVYNDVVANINRLGWSSADLNIRDRVRASITG